jgi:hypothetical protein
MRRAFLAVSVLLSIHASPIAAQSVAPLSDVQPGARIRVDAPGIVAGRFVGTVLTRRADTLTIGNPATSPVTVPLTRVTSLEVSRGKSRSAGALRGTVWGAPIGAGLGLFAIALSDHCKTCTDEPSGAEGVALFTLSGAVWGAGIGAIVGRERWDRYQLDARTSLCVRRDGVAIAFTVVR